MIKDISFPGGHDDFRRTSSLINLHEVAQLPHGLVLPPDSESEYVLPRYHNQPLPATESQYPRRFVHYSLVAQGLIGLLDSKVSEISVEWIEQQIVDLEVTMDSLSKVSKDLKKEVLRLRNSMSSKIEGIREYDHTEGYDLEGAELLSKQRLLFDVKIELLDANQRIKQLQKIVEFIKANYCSLSNNYSENGLICINDLADILFEERNKLENLLIEKIRETTDVNPENEAGDNSLLNKFMGALATVTALARNVRGHPK